MLAAGWFLSLLLQAIMVLSKQIGTEIVVGILREYNLSSLTKII